MGRGWLAFELNKCMIARESVCVCVRVCMCSTVTQDPFMLLNVHGGGMTYRTQDPMTRTRNTHSA